MNGFDRFFRILLPITLLAAGVTALAVGWFTQPARLTLGYAPEQPVNFSHKLHAGDNHIPCLYCHAGAERSRFAGVPPLQTCMNCHSLTRSDRPSISKIAEAFRKDSPLAWVRVHQLPDHVYFDHRPHVRAGVACQSCHGEVQAMERVIRVMDMRMGNCLNCHRDPTGKLPPGSPAVRGPENCGACHR